MTRDRERNRHAAPTRVWHWINLLAIIVLFMSGLNISNAHPYLYWGEWGFAPEQAWLEVPRFPGSPLEGCLDSYIKRHECAQLDSRSGH